MKRLSGQIRNRIFKAVVAGVTILSLLVPMLYFSPTVVEASEYDIPDKAKSYDGHYYMFYALEEAVSWDKAEEMCEAVGGHLATPENASEEAFIEKLIPKKTGYCAWIGIKKNAKDIWVYPSGTKVKWFAKKGVSDFDYWSRVYLNSADNTWMSHYDGKTLDSYICEWDTSTERVLPKQVKWDRISKVSKTVAALFWYRVKDAKGYVIYRKVGKNGNYVKIATIKGSANVAYLAKGMKKGTTYYFCIRAYKTILGEKSYGELSVDKKFKMT